MMSPAGKKIQDKERLGEDYLCSGVLEMLTLRKLGRPWDSAWQLHVIREAVSDEIKQRAQIWE